MSDEATDATDIASGDTAPGDDATPEASERAPEEIRSRLALALDVDDIIPALRLARELSPWFGTMKVGLELYSATGPEAITTLVDLGVDVFCDLKLHDIPTTVGRAARVVGSLGARHLTTGLVTFAPGAELPTHTHTCGESLTVLMPCARLVLLPGALHRPHQASPDTVLAEIRRFLSPKSRQCGR